MDYKREQADEIEALQAIYPDEFEMISVDPPSYKIHIMPNPGNEDNHVALFLICEIPPHYPEEIPILTIEVEKGLGKKHKESLMEIIINLATENLGVPSIFAIAEAIREWLVDNNVPGQDGSMYAEMTRRMQQKDVEQKKKADKAAVRALADSEGVQVLLDPGEEDRIRKRQAGTPVTVETFLLWRAKFDAEERERLRAVRGGGREVTVISSLEDKPTGKQLFLSNKAGLEDAILQEGEAEILEDDAPVEVEVDEDLFAGEEDLDDLTLEDIEEDAEEGSGTTGYVDSNSYRDSMSEIT